jgi:hypothetical protein
MGRRVANGPRGKKKEGKVGRSRKGGRKEEGLNFFFSFFLFQPF